MNAPEIRECELAPLRKIRDNYEKVVIALECDMLQTQDGIKIIRATDFLLENIIYNELLVRGFNMDVSVVERPYYTGAFSLVRLAAHVSNGYKSRIRLVVRRI